MTLPFSSAGLSVDLGTVTSGANWLLERQGSGGEWGEVEMFPDLDQVLLLLLFPLFELFTGGEWGEVEMFPDLDQVERASKCWGPLRANIYWVRSQ